MFRFSMKAFALAAVVTLSACSGEEWTTVPYDNTPYGFERTAGSGVAYVRASMAPSKGLKAEENLGVQNLREIDEAKPAPKAEVIEPVAAVEPAPAPEPAPPIQDAEPIFNKEQRK